MTLKTKLFSLILLGLLVLPVIMSPARNGDVLGVNDRRTGTVNTDAVSTQSPETDLSSQSSASVSEVLKQNKIGEIASGVRDIKTVDNTSTGSPSQLEGKIIWDENAKTPVSTDKFPLGNSIKIQNGEKILKVVVSNPRILATDTILVLDKKTFQDLGGDLEKGEINAIVSLDQ
jgi:hypothetical protein